MGERGGRVCGDLVAGARVGIDLALHVADGGALQPPQLLFAVPLQAAGTAGSGLLSCTGQPRQVVSNTYLAQHSTHHSRARKEGSRFRSCALPGSDLSDLSDIQVKLQQLRRHPARETTRGCHLMLEYMCENCMCLSRRSADTGSRPCVAPEGGQRLAVGEVRPSSAAIASRSSSSVCLTVLRGLGACT